MLVDRQNRSQLMQHYKQQYRTMSYIHVDIFITERCLVAAPSSWNIIVVKRSLWSVRKEIGPAVVLQPRVRVLRVGVHRMQIDTWKRKRIERRELVETDNGTRS